MELSYLYNFGVSSHFEGESSARAHGEAKRGDPVAEDLRVLLQDSVGRLQQGNKLEKKLLQGALEA